LLIEINDLVGEILTDPDDLHKKYAICPRDDHIVRGRKSMTNTPARALTNPVFGGLPTTIFTTMSALASEHGAINLGQGFPDEDGPESIRATAARVLMEGPNQYPPMRGMPALRDAIAAHSRRFYDLAFDPAREVIVTSGATEALAACILGLAGPGDKAVVIEPAYDSYRPILNAAGARIEAIRLAAPDFRLHAGALDEALRGAKLLLINSPLNPLGRVLSREELEIVAAALIRHDAYAICDEVYEHLSFDNRPHIPLIALPGMRERCVRVGSAGKMFALTGWKVGWIEGPAGLMDAIANAHQFLTFTTSPALQLGVAHALEREMGFTLEMTRSLQKKRDLLSAALRKVGFALLPCEGTYFVTGSIKNLTNEADAEFCKRLTREAGVAAIPLSAFYAEDAPADLVRFAFCKKESVLESAIERLERYFR
jgi:aspartate/methionine/tyrosine aminotransferase